MKYILDRWAERSTKNSLVIIGLILGILFTPEQVETLIPSIDSILLGIGGIWKTIDAAVPEKTS